MGVSEKAGSGVLYPLVGDMRMRYLPMFPGAAMENQKGRCVMNMHEDGVLTEADIPELVEELYDVCHKWKIIGIRLGLPLPKLDTMSQKYHFSDCIETFCHVLQEWMKSRVNHAPPTWTVLLDVLKSRIVGECSLAEKIRASLNHQCSKDDVAKSENVEKDSESIHEVSTSSSFELYGRFLCSM